MHRIIFTKLNAYNPLKYRLLLKLIEYDHKDISEGKSIVAINSNKFALFRYSNDKVCFSGQTIFHL